MVPVVKELVVSAGKSVQITLPKNEVQLNAYVLPEPEEGMQPFGNTAVCGAVYKPQCIGFSNSPVKTGASMWAYKPTGSAEGSGLHSWRSVLGTTICYESALP